MLDAFSDTAVSVWDSVVADEVSDIARGELVTEFELWNGSFNIDRFSSRIFS